MTTTANIHPSPLLQYLEILLGPDALARTVSLPDDEELELINEALDRHDGNVAAAAGVSVDPDTAAYLQTLNVGVRR